MVRGFLKRLQTSTEPMVLGEYKAKCVALSLFKIPLNKSANLGRALPIGRKKLANVAFEWLLRWLAADHSPHSGSKFGFSPHFITVGRAGHILVYFDEIRTNFEF